jgi:hypothetical protein
MHQENLMHPAELVFGYPPFIASFTTLHSVVQNFSCKAYDKLSRGSEFLR